METTQRHQTVITIAVMLGILLAAMEGTIVATAMPTIIGRLGGISLYSWVFTIYLLMSTAAVPIYGKLSDVYGRKPVYLVAVVLFLVGSALCGFATSMEQLILFRAIQGIGAGGVQPVAMTIVGDTFAIEQRARIQGLFSAVWGVSSIIAPAIGGLMVDYLAWQWIFYFNIPFGILSMAMIWFGLKERVERKRMPSIDVLGAILLTASVGGLQVALLQIRDAGIGAPLTIGMLVGTALLAAWFFVHERRQAEPILPFHLYKNPIIGSSTLAALILGMVVLGLTAFMPAFIQGALGGTATESGITLIPVAIGWTVGSFFVGKSLMTLGYRTSATLGVGAVGIGTLVLALLASTNRWLLMAPLGLIGIGAGYGFTTFTIATQNAVGWSSRGVVTGNIQFARTMGGTLGTAILGAVFTASLLTALSGLPGATPDIANKIVDSQQRATIPPDLLTAASLAVGNSLTLVFYALAALSIVAIFAARSLPSGDARTHVKEDAPRREEASII